MYFRYLKNKGNSVVRLLMFAQHISLNQKRTVEIEVRKWIQTIIYLDCLFVVKYVYLTLSYSK